MIRIPLPGTGERAPVVLDVPDVATITIPFVGQLADDDGKLVVYGDIGWTVVQEDASYWQVDNSQGYWSIDDRIEKLLNGIVGSN